MKAQTKWFFIVLLGLLILSKLTFALPSAPGINILSNTTAVSGLVNESAAAKGTITTVTLNANQQTFKWKAYVGNVTGKVALSNAGLKSIYDWTLGTAGGGEVYASRFSTINWYNISCASQTSVNNEQAAVGMASGVADNINSTFSYTNHKLLTVATNPGLNAVCKSTATYLTTGAQAMGPAAFFQEVLIQDSGTGSMIYSTFIEPGGHLGYDGTNSYDFQLIVAENESATVPTTYFFWVELG